MITFKSTALLEEAQQRTGLDDFGDADFLPALEILLEDINRGASISASRTGALKARLMRLLSDRLYFTEDLKNHPEILLEQISSPVEISSLPRTGSTKLHRLLAASGLFQFLPMWKTHRFARLPGKADGGEAERIAEIRRYETWMLEASPDIRSGHPMFTEEAEEDQWLGECTFRRPMTAVMFDAPNYALWLSQQDPRVSQRYFKQQLQYLQWQTRQLHGEAEAGKPWLLKSPDNFGCENILTELFPGMRFIITHRDPVQCLPSSSTMSVHFRRLYAEDYDAKVMLGPMIQMISAFAQAHLTWRQADTESQVIDVAFRDITDGGPALAKQLLQLLELPVSEAALANMARWERENAQHKHGKNHYSLEALGATEHEIRHAFRDYIQRYRAFI